METLYKLREKWSETPKLLQKFEPSNSWIQDRDGSKIRHGEAQNFLKPKLSIHLIRLTYIEINLIAGHTLK